MRASGGRPSGPPTSDSAPELRSLLTPRQCAVWDLLAGGLSNREIGESLGISERTVEVHVAAILRKAGVTSRSRLLALLNQ
nr:LuxR C-terminal-related transcriptional regulator [Leucobacter ruminantium]